jgi:hypothetical protein
MDGARGAEFERIVARFNASQKRHRVVPTYKGAYDEAAVEAVTARSTRNFAARAPHIVQASELAGAFLLEQKDVARPLWQVMTEARAVVRAEPALAPPNWSTPRAGCSPCPSGARRQCCTTTATPSASPSSTRRSHRHLVRHGADARRADRRGAYCAPDLASPRRRSSWRPGTTAFATDR